MSDKKADKPRYWLTFLLKDLAVGESFKPDAPHLTIIPWFVTDGTSEGVVASFHTKFSGHKAFNIGIGPEDEFKNKRKIPINLVRPSAQMELLHQEALEWFSETEARWALKTPHVGEDFVAHIRRHRGHNLSEGDRVRVSSLSLIAASRRGDDIRTVIGKVVFGEN